MAVVDASLIASAMMREDVNHLQALSWLNRQVLLQEVILAPSILAPEVAGAIYRISRDIERAERASKWLTHGLLIRLISVSHQLATEASRIAIGGGIRGC